MSMAELAIHLPTVLHLRIVLIGFGGEREAMRSDSAWTPDPKIPDPGHRGAHASVEGIWVEGV